MKTEELFAKVKALKPESPEIKRGDFVKVNDTHGEAKVMAVADGYAMLRYPRCMPFVEPLSNLTRVSP